jgi:hypothetical protein
MELPVKPKTLRQCKNMVTLFLLQNMAIYPSFHTRFAGFTPQQAASACFLTAMNNVYYFPFEAAASNAPISPSEQSSR